MKRLLLASAGLLALMTAVETAAAADLRRPVAVPAKAPVMVPYFTWTGVYVGADIGYGWASAGGTLTNAAGLFPTPWSASPNGVLGGGYIGANYQINQFVLGVEGDIEAAGITGSGTSGGFTMTNKVDTLGSIRGRLGYAFDRFLVYGTGGWAWSNGHTDYGVAGGPTFFTNGESRSGWTAGGGVEYAFTNNIIGRLEYRYTDLGSKGYIDPVSNSAEQGNKLTINAVRAGISYKFW